MPRISVIVPLYNTRDFAGECIASLRAQTFGDFEAVCVDDGSTDGTLEVARAAAGDDARFRFFSQPNAGLSAARNAGLDHAVGEYVAFLDSDDLYEPDALRRMDEAARADDVDVLDFSARTFYETDAARRIHEEDYGYRRPLDGVMAGHELFARHVERGSYASSACYHLVRRSLLADGGLRFGVGLLHEDELFTPLLYARAGRAAFLCEPLYLRRMREGSIMTSRRGSANVRSLVRISQLLHAWIIDNAADYPPAFCDAFCRNLAVVRDETFQLVEGMEEAELDGLLSGMDLQERVDFDLTCRFAQAPAQARYEDVTSSRAYKAADRLAAAPRALRDRLVRRTE